MVIDLALFFIGAGALSLMVYGCILTVTDLRRR
jgi:hypothetical protein